MNWLLAALAAIAAALTPGACSEDAPARVPALVVGDSLTVGARDYGDLQGQASELGLDLEVVADEGQPTPWGIDQVQARRSVPPVVVVALGSNPGTALDGFAEQAGTLVDVLEARGARQIVWVPPVASDPDDYAEHRAALADLAAARPSVHVVSWPDEVRSHPEWFMGDGLHLSEVGYGALAQQMVVGILEAGDRLAV